MRIIFVTHSLGGGGAERVVARLSSYLASIGHDVSVLMLSENIITYDINSKVSVKFVEPKLNIKIIRYLDRLLRLRNTVKSIKPDIVLSFSAPVNIMVLKSLRGLNVKLIISERNNPYLDLSSNKIRKERDRLYRLADGLVFQTEDARDYFDDEIRKKSTIIINPIDNNIPDPFSGVREKVIVSVARLDPQKNQKLLIDSFAEISDKIKDYQLHIYGIGVQKDYLQGLIDNYKLGDRIKLMGYCDNVLERIVKTSLFVLPSNYEGISNSLLEALAIGLPVISTDHPIGGARLLIDSNVNGLLIPVGDKESLKSAILRILEDKELSLKFSTNAVHVRDKVSIDNISQQWINFIHLIID